MIEQGSDEWLAQRLGKLTASRIYEILPTKRGVAPSTYHKYMRELAVERITGVPNKCQITQPMAWGMENEEPAKRAYEFYTNKSIIPCGFVPHPSINDSGATPDGMIGDDGIIEIKCPNTETHIEYLVSQSVPDKYIAQMNWQMECTGRDWCQFVSYDPRMPEEYSLFQKTVHKDASLINDLRCAATAFLERLSDMVNKISTLGQKDG